MRPGVFIERDGVLNEVRVEHQHQISPLTLDEFRVKKGVLPQLQRLKEAGLVLIATTNQPGIARGCQSRRELDRMHDLLRRTLPLDDIVLCPHDEADECPCRKPQPGLLTEAAFEWHIDLDHSFVVSDKWQDAEAAWAAGCTSLLLKSPWVNNSHHDFVLPSLAAITDKILQLYRAAHALVA
jgi:D-glycero-D-manno-heptose 1,7-bisphosphate phosphatase